METLAQRARMAKAVNAPENDFGFNAARLEFERLWNRENYAVLMRRLYALPTDWRFFIKHRVFDALESATSLTEDDIGATCDRIIGEYPELAAHYTNGTQ